VDSVPERWNNSCPRAQAEASVDESLLPSPLGPWAK